VVRELVQPEAPELFANLTLGRIAMLVEGFQITEHTGEFFPRNAEFLWIHDSMPLFTRV
jgi:hypothetical protein